MMFNNVLLIDDDPINNFLNAKLIKKLNICKDILVLNNGEEGIRFLLNGNLPDLILLDINMPVMNGFEFLELFKGLKVSGKENIDIFLLTSSCNIKDLERISEFPVKGYLQKPLTAEKLFTALGVNSSIVK